MTTVARNGDDFVIDAGLLAEAFGLTPAEVPALMREGRITSRCETGTGADAGFFRLTFWHTGRACRFTVDETGTILKQSRFDAVPREARPETLP